MKHNKEIADNEAAGKAELQREQLVGVGFPQEGLRGCTTGVKSTRNRAAGRRPSLAGPGWLNPCVMWSKGS